MVPKINLEFQGLTYLYDYTMTVLLLGIGCPGGVEFGCTYLISEAELSLLTVVVLERPCGVRLD